MGKTRTFNVSGNTDRSRLACFRSFAFQSSVTRAAIHCLVPVPLGLRLMKQRNPEPVIVDDPEDRSMCLLGFRK